MNKIIDLMEWKQAKAARRETAVYDSVEADFAQYEEILEMLDLLPKVLITRVVQFCLTHYVTFDDLKRKCDY